MKNPTLSKIVGIALAVLIAASPWAAHQSHADESSASPAPSGETVFVTKLSDGTDNVWTQKDLVEALGLMNRKYRRDMETESGRIAWHGKVVSVEVDADAGTRTVTHEDGYVHIGKFGRRKSKQELELMKAAEAARIQEERLKQYRKVRPDSVVDILIKRENAQKVIDKGETKTVTVDLATGKEVSE